MFYIDCTVAFVSCALKAVYMPAVVWVSKLDVVSVAIESMQVDIVKQLIEAGCDLNAVETDHHSTALHRVVRYC